MTTKKVSSARRTHKVTRTDIPTAATSPNDAKQPALPAEATKPLCDLVEGYAKTTIDAWHRAHVESVRRYQMSQPKRTVITMLPPPTEALGLLSLLVQRAGIAERKAILQVIAPLVDGPTQQRIVDAIGKYRGPVTDTMAVWSQVGESANASASVMSLNTDYALAK